MPIRRITVRRVGSMLLLTLALTACQHTSATDIPQINGPPKCHDTSSCAGGFSIRGADYVLSCAGIRPDLIGGEVLARGTYDDKPTEVRRVRGVDPHVLVALRRSGGLCGTGDVVRSPWSMAFRIGPGNEAAVRRASCLVIDSAERARSHCG